MDCEVLKSTNHSCWSDFQYVGLKAAGVPALNTKRLYGGKLTEQIGGKPLKGKVVLIVNQGGLCNGAVPAAVKELFKHEVLPALTERFPQIGKKFTGKMELHYREGLLSTFDLI